MTKFKKIMRLTLLVLMILLAAAGVGLFGGIMPTHREKYMDKEIKIEQVDKKEESEDEEDDQLRN